MVNGVSTFAMLRPNSFMISASKQIVPENESHEAQHQKQTGPIGHFHHPFRHRPADDGLNPVEQQMAPVEGGNRQKVQNTDPYGQQRNELHQPFESELC